MKKIVLLLFLAISVVASAQMIGATNSQGTFRPAEDSPLIRPTGPAIRLSVGSPMVTLAYNHWLKPWLMFGAGAGYNNAFIYRYEEFYDKPANSWNWVLHDTYSNSNVWGANDCIPVFLEAEARTPGYKWSVFLNVKLGYNIMFDDEKYPYVFDSRDEYSYSESVYCAIREEYKVNYVHFSLMAGASYKNLDFGIGYTNADAALLFGDCFYLSLSYNFPFTTLRKWLMF